MYNFDVVYEVKKNSLRSEHNAAVPPSAPTLKSAPKPLVALAIRYSCIIQKAVEPARVACGSISDSHI